VATVELLLSPLPSHVRTARLVGVAAARRAGLDDDYVADLRLALGEACTRAVALHADHAPATPVRVLVRDEPAWLVVEVTDHGPPAAPLTGDIGDLLGDDDVDPQVALSVLSGLVDDVDITTSEFGTTITLRWPLPPRQI
jgi:anti-sigma regulatory factor (Ser/Thr protein kinase)